MNQQHSHSVVLSSGVIHFHDRIPNSKFQPVTHNGIVVAIETGSSLDNPDLEGKEISAFAEQLSEIDIEERSFSFSFLEIIPSRILLKPMKGVPVEGTTSKIDLVFFSKGDYGCSKLPIKDGKLDSEVKSSGDHHIILDKAQADKDMKKCLFSKVNREETYKCRVILSSDEYGCWNKEINSFIENGGNEDEVEIGLDDHFSCWSLYGKVHQRYRLFIGGDEKCKKITDEEIDNNTSDKMTTGEGPHDHPVTLEEVQVGELTVDPVPHFLLEEDKKPPILIIGNFSVYDSWIPGIYTCWLTDESRLMDLSFAGYNRIGRIGILANWDAINKNAHSVQILGNGRYGCSGAKIAWNTQNDEFVMFKNSTNRIHVLAMADQKIEIDDPGNPGNAILIVPKGDTYNTLIEFSPRKKFFFENSIKYYLKNFPNAKVDDVLIALDDKPVWDEIEKLVVHKDVKFYV